MITQRCRGLNGLEERKLSCNSLKEKVMMTKRSAAAKDENEKKKQTRQWL